MRSWQEATLHWRQDTKTPALRKISIETVQRNDYSSNN